MGASPQKTSPSPHTLKEQKDTSVFEPQRSSDDVLVVRENGQVQLFDLEVARQREVKRRLALMGAYAHSDFDKNNLRALAQSHYLPESRLTSWKRALQLHGVEGLLPDDWLALSEKSQRVATERLGQLGK